MESLVCLFFGVCMSASSDRENGEVYSNLKFVSSCSEPQRSALPSKLGGRHNTPPSGLPSTPPHAEPTRTCGAAEPSQPETTTPPGDALALISSFVSN